MKISKIQCDNSFTATAKSLLCLAAAVMVLELTIGNTAFSACINISDVPMETKVQSAPANIMFVLDNSGSMDWEFMTPENDGLYSSEYYLYPDSAYINGNDRVYWTGHELDSEKNEWKSQWSGYNKIFYNPNAFYSPWPQKSNADTVEPWSNPNNTDAGDSRFDMAGEYYSVGTGGAVEVIVDNQDSGFFLNTPAAWSMASNNGYPYYGSDYYFTSSSNDANGDWVTWTPVLPSAGDYTVAVWWTSNSSRDSSVYYDIVHNSATDTSGPYDMEYSGGQWNDIGTFTFSADGTEYVKLDPDSSGGSRYSADAVKFYIPGSTVSIKNAHYFIINDLDNDQEKDSNEDIYLVNFVNGTREYYLFDDHDSDDEVDNGELYFKDYADVPDGAKAGRYDEDGNFVRFSTDAEDLQNFANWFSFYRKRELTAKAAVAGAISNLDWVYVGFYSINSGLRQTVLPIEVESSDIIIDNSDSGYLESGDWSESSASSEYGGGSRYTNDTGDYATWTPNLPSADNYKVYVWYDYWDTRDTNAKYTVHHAGGDSVFRIDQQVDYSQWVELGEFGFNAGTSGYVKVTRDSSSTENSTSADAVKFEMTSGGVSVDETDTLLSSLYAMDSSGNTPLRTALNNVGRYYDKDDGDDGNLGASPYADSVDGGACQQAFTIVMTDGFWNGSSPNVGNQDANTSSIFDGTPYADSYSSTLADVAIKYYKEDLVDSYADVVPTNSCDLASHQHMVTYGVSFGVTGTLNPEDYHSCLLNGGAPPWPNPWDGDQEKIDDLYHAAINGRGLFFSASNPQELVTSLIDATSNIASRMSSGASVAVNGEELNTDTVLYQASYISDTWTGDVTAYPVDPISGEIKREESDILWHASDELQLISADDRNIVTYDTVSEVGIQFKYSSLTAAQKLLLNSNSDVVDYIRGKEITGFRSRTKKLADIVHSAPLLMGNTIYAGGNDGMLHAFDADSGKERFAYIPRFVMGNFYNALEPDKSFFKPGYEHQYFVDLTPVAKTNVDYDNDPATDDPATLLIGGLGKGGMGYYCLDITNADSKDYNSPISDIQNMVKWEYPDPTTTDNDMGYSYSTPVIVKSNLTSHEWIVIFGNGYESPNGNGVLYILDVNGDLIKKIDTGVGGCNGLSSPSVIDTNNDFRADYVYAGDLKGNLWKFDLTDSDVSNWEVAYKDSSSVSQPFFSVPGKAIVAKPDVMRHCEFNMVNDNLTGCDHHKDTSGFMVMFGTGRYFNDTDRTATDSQYIFGLWDYGDDTDDQEYLGSFDSTASPQLSNMNANITLLEQTVVDSGDYNSMFYRTLSDNEPDWTTKCDGNNPSSEDVDPDPDSYANAGWFFELPTPGERVIKDLFIRNEKLVYLTFTPDSSPCSGGGSSIIHEVDACTGGRLTSAQFDINGDGEITEEDMIDIGLTDINGDPLPVPPTGQRRQGLLHPPVFIQLPGKPVEMKIFSSSAATTETLFEVSEPRGLFYWLEH